MEKLLMVFCTFPDPASARQIATLIVERQLAACVNILPAVESIYRWQGNVETAVEVLAIFKTTAATFPAFQQALSEAHPYQVPEILTVEPCEVSPSYREWLANSVAPLDR